MPCTWSQVACVLTPGVLIGYAGPWTPSPLLTVTLNDYGLIGSIDSSWTAIGASMFHFELQASPAHASCAAVVPQCR